MRKAFLADRRLARSPQRRESRRRTRRAAAPRGTQTAVEEPFTTMLEVLPQAPGRAEPCGSR